MQSTGTNGSAFNYTCFKRANGLLKFLLFLLQKMLDAFSFSVLQSKSPVFLL